MMKILLSLIIISLLMQSAICFCWESYRSFKYKRMSCELTQIPSDIPKEAKEVNLKDNNILDIEDEIFLNVTQLTKLNMGGNRLTHIRTSMFQGPRLLKDLDLRSNKISDIDPGAFLSLQQCTDLWLPYNQLTCLRADTFRGLVSLDLLDLYSNQISFIEDGAFSHLPRIRVLYLNNNRLVTLMGEQWVIQSQNLFLFLDGNPLHCDSRMCWIKDAERDGRIKLKDKWNPKPQCVNYPGVHWDNIKLPCNVSDNVSLAENMLSESSTTRSSCPATKAFRTTPSLNATISQSTTTFSRPNTTTSLYTPTTLSPTTTILSSSTNVHVSTRLPPSTGISQTSARSTPQAIAFTVSDTNKYVGLRYWQISLIVLGGCILLVLLVIGMFTCFKYSVAAWKHPRPELPPEILIPDSEKDVQEAKAMTVGASSWVNSISQTLQLQYMEAVSEPALDSDIYRQMNRGQSRDGESNKYATI